VNKATTIFSKSLSQHATKQESDKMQTRLQCSLSVLYYYSLHSSKQMQDIKKASAVRCHPRRPTSSK